MAADLLLGRYRIDQLLGTGAFATVHRAHDEQLDDQVAVKVLAHNHAADPDLRRRFVAEGQVLRRLHSPHLVTVHDLAETDDGRPLLILELCDRGTLRTRATDARAAGWTPTDADAVAVAGPLAAAIAAMDQAGVVHRDLTPANVLLTTAPPHPAPTDPPSTLIRPDERLVVTDLGFCKDRVAGTGLTAAGGTDGFQPPEQRAVGGQVDVRSDLYAASAVLTWVLTGRTADAPHDASHALHAAGISHPLATAIAQSLHPEPDRRPQTADGWLDAIIDAATTTTPHPTPRQAQPRPRGVSGRRTAAAAVGLVLLAAAVNAVANRDESRGGSPASVTVVDGDQTAGVSNGSANGQPTGDLAALPATPTPTPTPTGPPPGFEERHAGQWEFELVTYEGWEYDVRIAIDMAFKFGSTIEQSPPGHARFTAAMHGDVTTTATPTVSGRRAPDLTGVYTAEFGQVDPATVAVGAGSCTATEAFDTTTFYCLLGYSATPNESVSMFDEPEDSVALLLEHVANQPPAYYKASFVIACDVALHLDGTVTLIPQPSANGCSISGEHVREFGQDA
jgi:eukaryotic-like serine/threonine-protein kinase